MALFGNFETGANFYLDRLLVLVVPTVTRIGYSVNGKSLFRAASSIMPLPSRCCYAITGIGERNPHKSAFQTRFYTNFALVHTVQNYDRTS